MEIKIGEYTFENDIDCKCIPDGFEIFADAVEKFSVEPEDFQSAHWGFGGCIIVEGVPDNKTVFKISAKAYCNNIKTYVGRIRWYQDTYWSESTGIHRLTAKEARQDGIDLVNYRLKDIFNKNQITRR